MRFVRMIVAAYLANISLLPFAFATETTSQSTLCHDAEKIYYAATFITLNPAQPYVRAVAVTNGRIVAVGSRRDVLTHCKGPKSQLIDLKHTVVTPGFIDTYSKFTLYGWLADAALDLSTTNSLERGNWKEIKSVEEFLANIKAQKIPSSSWLIVNGYDIANLSGNKLTQADLDKISETNPIIVFYLSGERALLNKAAVKKLETNTVRVSENGEISGDDLLKLTERLISQHELVHAIHTASNNFSQHGYTTVTEASGSEKWLPTYNAIIRDKKIPVDIIYSPSSIEASQRTSVLYRDNPQLYIGPVLTKLDGPVQELSAFLTTPYINNPNVAQPDWHGKLLLSPQQIQKTMVEAAEKRIPIALEANGDAAIDLILNITEKLQIKHGKENFNPIINNAQVIRKDQLSRIHHLGIKINWFAPHLEYWGNTLCHNLLGPARAAQTLPLASTLRTAGGISIHANTPSTAPDALRLMNEATERKVHAWHYSFNSKCPETYAPKEKVNALDALKALTIDAASLYGVQKDKGSIEVGKIADMTLLTADPLADKHTEIKVLGTIHHGNLHYVKDAKPVIIPNQ